MVTYIRSDLDFILKQIKIAEADAAFRQGISTGDPLNPAKALFGPGGSIPTYNLAWGLRYVDGSFNHLLPGQTEWGASDNEFPEPLGTQYRTVMVDADPGPGVMMVPVTYTPGVDNDGPDADGLPGGQGSAGPSDVFDPTVRTISNLLVDQTLGNPSAILTALQRAGIVAPENELAVTATISDAYEPLKPLFNAVSTAVRAHAAASASANANPGNQALQDAAAARLVELNNARAALEAADDGLMTLLEANGIELEGANVKIVNAAPDEGLSAPFNSWFTLFGQFFDHGLDLVAKGGNGTVFIPLLPDDPLYVEGGQTNFMVLTRATTAGPGADGILGDDPTTVGINEGADDTDRPVNTTTAYVDQNQTYTSHPSHQVFLREYVFSAANRPVATGHLIEGANGGMATWGELKVQAADMLGIQLLDKDVGNVPLLATDPYGEFIRGPNGFPQIVLKDGTLLEGNPAANGGLGVLVPDNAFRTGHAFLADIAHNAVPEGLADGDIEIGLGNNDPNSTPGYDNELLDRHFIAGDGRVNENIGLTAVHHVFHAEHNRLAEHTKSVVLTDAAAMLAGGSTQAQAVAFLNEWLIDDVGAVPTTQAQIDGLIWDGERIFQAAKFGTEMQYQHLVFEEFARKIQPNINVFLVPDGFDTTIDPSIVAEFAHVVYRFGHSMLTETIDRLDPTFTDHQIGLIEGFLNPIAFNGVDASIPDGLAAGDIIRGMTRQQGNEIDEFVTSALRNNLLGLPLDLATINLARGRDTGVPSLNAARAQFYEAANQDVLLKPYESWVDFAGHLKHEASIINFIAAYGTHSLITGQTTIEGKRDAAMALIFGTSSGAITVPTDPTELAAFNADRLAFLNATGTYAGGTLGGLNNVDLWIGGLAEEIMPFGGMLGSTFNFVFEVQMEKLQNGDRFYYLQRLDGLHLFGEMENNSFASMIMRNTNATHLPSDVFSTPGLILEVDQTKQYNPGLGDFVDINAVTHVDGADPVGGGILTPLVVRGANYLKYTGDEHVLLGGTEGNDTLIASIGDDTLYGDGGNDRLEGGFGNDIINAGAGDDIVVDSGGDDNIKAGAGHDVVHAGPGLDLVMGNDGQDFIFLGTDMGSEVFAGTGNDFIYGNKNAERILGNEGDDWIETGTFDGAPGDNFDEVFSHDEIDGNDVFLGDGGFDEFIGEGGDEIFVGSAGRGKMVGMSGFDWATYKDNTFGVNADLSIPIVFDEAPTLPQNAALDEYESVEGLSGTKFNDVLKGSNTLAEERLPALQGGTEGYQGSFLDAQGIALIKGLDQVLGAGVNFYNAGDIILGGDGSDLIQGNAGDDIIDGDKWLNVRIGIYNTWGANGPTGAERTFEPINGVPQEIKSMTSAVTLRLLNGVEVASGGALVTKPLSAWMFEGRFNPGQLAIVREIKIDGTNVALNDPLRNIDTAKFQGLRSEYAFSATADGQVIVTDTTELNQDGSDRLRNIERVEFSDNSPLNIIVGTAANDVLNGTAQDDLMLGLGGNDVLNGGDGNDILVGGPNGASSGGTFIDNFNGTASYTDNNGTLSFNGGWVESGGETPTSPTGGDININGERLRFQEGIDGGETITRAANLTGYTSAILNFDWQGDDLDGGETVSVQAFNGTTWDTLGTLGGDTSDDFPIALTAAQIGSHTAVRFVANGTYEGGENFFVDNFTITASAFETLNGGNGNDTYSFTLGDGNDVINELANQGNADLISILVPAQTDPVTGLPVLDPATDLPVRRLTSLNAADNNGGTTTGDLVITYAMENGATPPVDQTTTVAGHFTGTNAQTGVERINFNNATYAGYLLAGDYFVNRADPGNRDGGGVNMSTNAVTNNQQNFIAGENGTADIITGGLLNDLIFGGTGDNDLFGGDGDDLLVGGNGGGDDDLLDGGLGADTMIGGSGNDDYVVDDLLDLVVEQLGQGSDEVLTELALLSIANMANVENLTYTGIDADQFVGTGNALANTISGGDLNDILDGGLGADTLVGGLGDDNYVVDNTGDVILENDGEGTDSVSASVSYTLGANVENLTLAGAAAINGTGNAIANTITGNTAANQLFGGGGDDTLNGGGGADLIDGGTGNDAIDGGADADIVIGGAGNDTVNVGNGNDVLRYTASGFGADTINNFDATGGTAATQDLIDLSAFGLTAANIGTTAAARIQIQDIEDGATDDTLITIRDAGGATIGTILLNELDNSNISATDFIFGAAAPTLPGATNAANTLTGTAGNDTIIGLQGNDTINAGDGDDTIIWNANAADPTDGQDTVNGGLEGTGGDTFVVNGRAVAENFRVYTRAAWVALGGGRTANAATEIVVTRHTGGGNPTNANIIAQLIEIEEIRINGGDPAPGTSTIGGDNIQVIGDFSTTSLRLNTITIDGEAGDDTIDISALSSAHRIVFKSNGGHDTIIGSLRDQDVVELPDGATMDDYTSSTDDDGFTTLSNGTHSIKYKATGNGPQVGGDDDEDEDDHEQPPVDDDDDDDHQGNDDDNDDDHDGGHDDDDDDHHGGHGGHKDDHHGGKGADVLRGDAHDNFLNGKGGRDMAFGGDGDDDVLGGKGADMLYGDDGNDRIFGQGGDDLIDGGKGNDQAQGGAGNDLFLAAQGDGNDTYWGDELGGCGAGGNDTLDMAAITANITVDLGTGFQGRGSASSSQSGSDVLWGIENVVTGSGDDQITASKAVNVMDGGAGEDTFRFLSTADADGDTILGFQPGDKVDLSAINAGSANGSFTLVNGADISAVGSLRVSHDVEDGQDYTIVEGNTQGGSQPEFKLTIKGHHALTDGDFNL